MFTNSDKLKAIGLSLWFGLVLMLKQVVGKIFYPFAYFVKSWVYGDEKIENYTMPEGVRKSRIKWVAWLFLDDDQPSGYPMWYAIELLGHEPDTKWEHFKCAYAWSAWRNPMYNVNYVYMGNRSEIVSYKKAFGAYTWNRKLRASNGDNGAQLVWFKTYDGRVRYLFSVATKLFNRVPLTIYYGWNADFNGRFTVAWKFK